MASAPAIRAESLSKRYQLGALPQAALVDQLGEALGRLRRGRRRPPEPDGEFWALRDVDFEIEDGEAVGVIGRNGAGKSTLLKLISRITPPTGGRLIVRGRVATLLEVGTGFHPELSGRENIYLNGAVLGMKRHEIARKYDEIVEFAGVERFLETPVKRYSSGMYMRLAFAVAAHLEPEILLVDEVLSVGDVEFQRKCLGKMREVTGRGRTVLFVSHNLGAITRLCSRALFLDSGRIVSDGPPSEVVSAYLERVLPGGSTGSARIPDEAPRIGTGELRLREVGLTGADGEPLSSVHLDQPFRITVQFEVFEDVDDAVVELGISTFGGDRVVTAQSVDREGRLLRFERGVRELSADIDVTMLPGDFTVDVGLHHITGVTVDYVQDALRFTALNASLEGEDHYPWSAVRGYVRPPSTWSEVREAAKPRTASG